MSDIISCEDKKAIEMVVELLLVSHLNTLKVCDIEEALKMEFDSYHVAAVTLQEVIKEYRAKKGL
jgi:hypothetical protein